MDDMDMNLDLGGLGDLGNVDLGGLGDLGNQFMGMFGMEYMDGEMEMEGEEEPINGGEYASDEQEAEQQEQSPQQQYHHRPRPQYQQPRSVNQQNPRSAQQMPTHVNPRSAQQVPNGGPLPTPVNPGPVQQIPRGVPMPTPTPVGQPNPGRQVHAMHPQQPIEPYPEPGQGAWSTDLYACFDDIPLCCLTWWCPCIVFGRIAEIVDRGATTFGTSATLYTLIMVFSGFQFVYSCTYRNKMRLQYGIPGDDFADYCTYVWCEPCALHQQYKELIARGFDPALGWHVNLMRQKQAQAQGVQMPPITHSGMTR